MPDWTRPGQRWRLVVPAGAVVVDAEAVDSRRTVAALPAGATVVLTGARRRVRARARTAGLRVDAEYLALPSLAEAVVLAPLATLPWTARAVLTVPPGVTRLHPVYSVAIAAVRAVPGLLRFAGPGSRRRREAAVTGRARPSRSRPPPSSTARSPTCSPAPAAAVLVGSRDPNAKLTVVVPTGGRRAGARIAVKVPTTAAAADVVRSEGGLLDALGRRLPADLAATVPRPVGYVDADGLPALVTTGLVGVPMQVALPPLAAHRATPAGRPPTSPPPARWLARLQEATAGAGRAGRTGRRPR